MLAYKNDPALRQKALDAMAKGLADDRLVQGTYMGCGGSGCAVGVIAMACSQKDGDEAHRWAVEQAEKFMEHQEDHSYLPVQTAVMSAIGLPAEIVYVLERIFELALTSQEGAAMVMDALRAIPVGLELRDRPCVKGGSYTYGPLYGELNKVVRNAQGDLWSEQQAQVLHQILLDEVAAQIAQQERTEVRELTPA